METARPSTTLKLVLMPWARLMACLLYTSGHTFESKLYTFNILDRVGGGDAFASGLIYAMLHDYRAIDVYKRQRPTSPSMWTSTTC